MAELRLVSAKIWIAITWNQMTAQLRSDLLPSGLYRRHRNFTGSILPENRKESRALTAGQEFPAFRRDHLAPKIVKSYIRTLPKSSVVRNSGGVNRKGYSILISSSANNGCNWRICIIYGLISFNELINSSKLLRLVLPDKSLNIVSYISRILLTW